MAVISTKEDNKLSLEITNGDLLKMEEILQEWNFKNEQCLLRFLISMLIETEDKELWIKSNHKLIPIGPALHSLKNNE